MCDVQGQFFNCNPKVYTNLEFIGFIKRLFNLNCIMLQDKLLELATNEGMKMEFKIQQTCCILDES